MTSPTRGRLLAMCVAASLLAVAGCSSSSKSASKSGGSTSAAATSAAATSAAASTPAGPSATTAATATAAGTSSGGKLSVTGAVAASLAESTDTSAIRCSVDAGGNASNIISFDGTSASYNLQMSIPAGTTTFPDASGRSGIYFYAIDNSKLEWGASNAKQAGTGTVTRSADNKTGTLDVQMTDAAPPGSPQLQPIHVSGSWSC